jgi:hypothetical protein
VAKLPGRWPRSKWRIIDAFFGDDFFDRGRVTKDNRFENTRRGTSKPSSAHRGYRSQIIMWLGAVSSRCFANRIWFFIVIQIPGSIRFVDGAAAGSGRYVV